MEQELAVQPSALTRQVRRFAAAASAPLPRGVVHHGVARLIEHRKAPVRALPPMRSVLSTTGSREKMATARDAASSWTRTTTSPARAQPAMPVSDSSAARAHLQRVFEMLTPELRELWLRLADGQTITDISRDTGVTRGTLYDRLGRLRVVAQAAGLRSVLER